jgi:hypothetical protein
MTPEGKVKEKVKKLLKGYGAYQHWPVSNGMGAPSLDCIGCFEGRYFAVETKAPGKKPTLRQEVTIGEIRAARGLVFVVDGDESLLLLKAWMEMIRGSHTECTTT